MNLNNEYLICLQNLDSSKFKPSVLVVKALKNYYIALIKHRKERLSLLHVYHATHNKNISSYTESTLFHISVYKSKWSSRPFIARAYTIHCTRLFPFIKRANSTEITTFLQENVTITKLNNALIVHLKGTDTADHL